MAILDNILAPPSLKDIAFESLKKAIITNSLGSQEFYSTEELARQLGISKTPVREAIFSLETKGFLTLFPRKGVRINALTEKKVRDLFEYRTPLETAVVRHIAPEMTDASIKKIERIYKRAGEAAESNDRFLFMRFDRRFHIFLVSLTGNELLIDALEHIRDLCDWMGSQVLWEKQHMLAFHSQHGAIIKGLKNRQPESCARFVEEHLNTTKDAVLKNLLL
jgi:DNA-binding GntR family transcriptional regulator